MWAPRGVQLSITVPLIIWLADKKTPIKIVSILLQTLQQVNVVNGRQEKDLKFLRESR